LSAWKVILAAAAIGALLWFLYPSRQLDTVRSEDVVEIHYMGGGPIGGVMADAVRQFEKESEEAHAKDLSRPIYRVISGQDAARDQTADPTRFLISVAGGVPPDVVCFDRFAITEWASRGAFTPLDDYIERDVAAGRPDVPVSEDFYPSCWDEAKFGGKVYGIPNGVDNRALFYNKDLLVRASWTRRAKRGRRATGTN